MKQPAAKKPNRRAFAASRPSSGAQAAQQSSKKVAENPFDKFANARKKHEVLNRKVKGEDRNVGRARGKVFIAYILLFGINMIKFV